MKKLTPAQIRVTNRIKAGNLLCCQYIDGKKELYYAHGGRPPTFATLRVLLAGGHLIKSGDGLFGASQSYRLADA